VAAVNELEALQGRIREFVRERDWEQFHSPKNLAMALIVEAGELVEQLQWLTEDESCNLPAEKLQAVEEELADIFVYQLRITDRLDVDLLTAAHDKMRSNESKYPANTVRGSSKKYTEYQ
jgi:NTP pyrophosphatase (non-canonical NTP hydrolase)